MLKPYQSLHYNLFQNTLHLMGNLEQKNPQPLNEYKRKEIQQKIELKFCIYTS